MMKNAWLVLLLLLAGIMGVSCAKKDSFDPSAYTISLSAPTAVYASRITQEEAQSALLSARTALLSAETYTAEGTYQDLLAGRTVTFVTTRAGFAASVLTTSVTSDAPGVDHAWYYQDGKIAQVPAVAVTEGAIPSLREMLDLFDAGGDFATASESEVRDACLKGSYSHGLSSSGDVVIQITNDYQAIRLVIHEGLIRYFAVKGINTEQEMTIVYRGKVTIPEGLFS